MSSAKVHEGVKLQTPLCLQPRASEAISSFIDSTAEFKLDGCRRHPSNPPSWSPDCFCFQVTSYLSLQLFQFLRARCMKTEGASVTGSPGNIHKPEARNDTEETQRKLLTFMLSGQHTSFKSCSRHDFIKATIK